VELLDTNFFPNYWIANDQGGCYAKDVDSDGILLIILLYLKTVQEKRSKYHWVVLPKLRSVVAKGRSRVADIFERRFRPWNTLTFPIRPLLLDPDIAENRGSAE
jgi:hypothetical protein